MAEEPAASGGMEGEGKGESKGGKKKEKQPNPKDAKKAERLLARQTAAAAVTEEADPLAGNYGDVELKALQSSVLSGRVWTKVAKLGPQLDEQKVLIRGRAQTIRAKGKGLGFIVVREAGSTVQCVVSAKENVVSKQMIKYISGLSKESIIDVEGVVTIPPEPIDGTTHTLFTSQVDKLLLSNSGV